MFQTQETHKKNQLDTKGLDPSLAPAARHLGIVRRRHFPLDALGLSQPEAKEQEERKGRKNRCGKTFEDPKQHNAKQPSRHIIRLYLSNLKISRCRD